MCLRFVFLLITRVAAWLCLSRREERWKTAEILILRHQLAILQRRQPRRPKLSWADRALLAALLSVMPKTRCRRLGRCWLPRTRSCAGTVPSSAAGPPGPRAAGRAGPRPRRNIQALVRRRARENPEREYRRIHGELAGLGVQVAAAAVGEILKASRIAPARRRPGPAWPQFLRSQAEAILACDFVTAGLQDGTQAYVLAVIEHATRRARILGVTLHPAGQPAAQQAATSSGTSANKPAGSSS
jgi:putative transposase